MQRPEGPRHVAGRRNRHAQVRQVLRCRRAVSRSIISVVWTPLLKIISEIFAESPWRAQSGSELIVRGRDESFFDWMAANYTITALKMAKAAGKNFALFTGFRRPHVPWAFPARFWSVSGNRLRCFDALYSNSSVAQQLLLSWLLLLSLVLCLRTVSLRC